MGMGTQLLTERRYVRPRASVARRRRSPLTRPPASPPTVSPWASNMRLMAAHGKWDATVRRRRRATTVAPHRECRRSPTRPIRLQRVRHTLVIGRRRPIPPSAAFPPLSRPDSPVNRNPPHTHPSNYPPT